MASTTRRRRRVPAAPATLALHGANCSVSDLAAALGVTDAAASRYLTGLRRPPADFDAALVRLIGEEEAARVRALIPPHTDDRLAPAA